MTLTLEISDELGRQIEQTAKERGLDVQVLIVEILENAVVEENHDLFEDLAHKRTLRDVPGLPPLADG